MDLGQGMITTGFVIGVALAIAYLAEVGVALFHPNARRRQDAMKALRLHRFTKSSTKPWWRRRNS